MHKMSAAILATSLTAASPFAAADRVFGIYAGAGVWQQEYSGDVASGITDVDVQDDLGLDDESNNVFYVAIEHFVPVVPNVRLQHADITIDGQNRLSRVVEFNGTTFNVDDDVSTEIDLTQTDAVFYYQLLDNVVSVDLGLAARFVDGLVSVESTVDNASAEFEGILPLAFGKVRVDLPLTGLWAAAEGAAVAYNGNSLIDFTAQVGYESDFGLGFELGYRAYRLELEDIDDIDSASLDISGPYAALNYHF